MSTNRYAALLSDSGSDAPEPKAKPKLKAKRKKAGSEPGAVCKKKVNNTNGIRRDHVLNVLNVFGIWRKKWTASKTGPGREWRATKGHGLQPWVKNLVNTCMNAERNC